MRGPPKRSWKSTAVLEASTSLVGEDPTPPAALPLLLAADGWTVQVGAGLWASPAWATECNTTGVVDTRRVAVLVPPACRYSRAWVTRSGNGDAQNPIKQAQHKHASSTGGGYTGNAVSVADSPVTGAEVYLQTDPALAMTSCAISGTGTAINNAPAAQVNRALAVPEGLAPSVEVYQLQNVAGACLQFWSRTDDLEGL